MPAIGEQEEGPVLAVVQLGNAQWAADCAVNHAGPEWIRKRRLREIVGVDQGLIDDPAIKRAVELVCARFVHQVHDSAGRVPELGGQAAGGDFHLLQRLLRALDRFGFAGAQRLGPGRFPVHPVEGVADGSAAL